MPNAGIADNSIYTADNIEVYEDIISQGLDAWIAENPGVDLVKDVSQYQWKSVLLYIYKYYIKPKRIDLLKVYNNKNNAYDIDKVNNLYEIYKAICFKCGKITSLADFSIISGIEDNVITAWGNKNDKVAFNPKGSHFHEKVMRDSEQSIAMSMISTGRNPVGYIALLNHYHDWATTAAANGQTEARRSPQEIAAAHGVAIEGNNAAVLPPPVVSDDL